MARKSSFLLYGSVLLGACLSFLNLSFVNLQGRVQVREPRTLLRAAKLAQPTRPVNAYVLYCLKQRNRVRKNLGDAADQRSIVKRLSQEWKELSASEKKKYKTRYEASMKQYKADLQAFMEAGGVVTKSSKKSRKSKKVRTDPSKPKRPGNAYMLWLKANRPSLQEKLSFTEVAKAAGAQWKAATAEDKAPYEKESATRMEEYKKALEEYKKS
eukprot:TRINITY_DN41182_c0_g1_i1.p1 TRINITY_DN41182_c0_g1~~TRINITY_DN41182_c0_g1_i1.p1  ORF type:complete len:213 (-),score=39.93 TRINITY_DN41182_c0_g1_i1:553-1191(-)